MNPQTKNNLVTRHLSLVTVFQDLRFGLRMLVKNLGFTTVAVLSLALGIGASVAVFSLVNAILLASLPVPNPHELRVINWSGGDPKINNFSGWIQDDGLNRKKGDSVSYPVFTHLREQCVGLADIFGYTDLMNITVRTRREAFAAQGLLVSDNFFSGLQAQPLMGRFFTPGESSGEDALGVVISYPWWEKYFDLDPNVLGQSLTLNGHSFTVIGVLPIGFVGVQTGGESEFYVSMAAQPKLLAKWMTMEPGKWWVHLMARKKTNAGDAQLQAALDVAFSHVVVETMKEPKVLMSDGRGGPAFNRDYYRKPLLLLLAVVGIVILVVCANLAGLLLSRGAARYHEFAVRSAIGAGRGRLIRQSLTESLLLSLLGGGLGIVLALWGKDVISRLLAGSPDGLHYDTSLDLKVLIYALAVTVTTAVLSGLLPALRAAHADPLDGLKARTLLGSQRMRSGRVLVVAQIALSLLLLTGAGLYVRTLVNIVHINPGFGMENLLLLRVNPRNAGYQGAETATYFERAQTALASIPGVRSVALTQYALLGGWMSGGGFFTLPDHPAAEGSRPMAHRITVSDSFFTTMNIPLRVGREFSRSDTDGAPNVVIVNETFVQKYLPNEYPIGQTLRVYDKTDWKIVGVCGDAKYTDIKGDVPPTVYFSYRQDGIGDGFIAVRSALPPAAIANSARQALASLDPNVPIIKVITQKQVRDEKLAQEWMFAILCGSLALLAVLLSCIGLYGLMAFNVTRRTGEIGIRMALGATRRNIAWSFLRDSLWMSAVGVFIGGLSALAFTRYLQSQLYGVEPHDPITMIVAVISIFFVTILAAWLPARRAARVEPMMALRCE